MCPIRTILVPTDYSTTAVEAFRLAHALARAIGARVLVLHVTRPPAVVVDGGRLSTDPGGGGPADLWAELRKLKAEDPSVVVEHEVIVADRPDVSHVLKMVEAQGCDLIVIGTRSQTDREHRLAGGLTEEVVRRARYMHLADLSSYVEAQGRAGALYKEQDAWARKALLNVAHSGRFSSDRTIREYAVDVWGAEPCLVD